MSIIACEKCGNQKSINAEECPHCHYRPVKSPVMAPCRACGTLLDKAVHRHYEQFSYMRHGSSFTGRRLVYEPCPKCGEPKPLRSFFWSTDFFIGGWLAVTGGCSFYGIDIWPHSNNDKDVTEKMFTIGVLIVAWIIFSVIWIRYAKKQTGL